MNETILIVDDDKNIRKGLSIRLRSQGYNTLHAIDQGTAMKMVKKHKPDLILLDIGLPDGNGLGVLEYLRGHPTLGATPVVVVTAMDLRYFQDELSLLQPDACFVKPVSNHDLLNMISKLLTDGGTQKAA